MQKKNIIKNIDWKRISRDPFIDWIFMLCVGLLVVTILIVIDVFTYIDVGRATSSVSEEGAFVGHAIVDKFVLKGVVDKIDMKAATSTTDKENIVPGDPSL